MTASSRDALNPELLLKHSGALHSLARRLVRDEETARDLVQETWLAALSRPPRRAASLSAWLHTVLRNFAYRRHHGEARRRRREAAVARPERIPETHEQLVECVESYRNLVGLVLELREPYRSTIVLHFFGQRSTAQVADEQGVAEATVRSRLGRGIAKLRESALRHEERWAGLAVIAAAPERVAAAAVAGTASSTAGGMAAVATTAGGTLMAKAWITSGLAVVVVALFWGGYSVGGAGRSSANLAADEARSEAAVARAELGALRERLEESTAELERLRELTGEQAHRIAALGGEIAKRDALTTAAASAAPEGEGEVPVLDDVDWEKLSTLLANRFDILSKMVRGHGQQSYTSEEQEQSLEVLSFILDVAKQARRVSSRPFFDPEFLTSFLEAVHTGTLGLDDEQRGELRGILDAVVESHLVDFDPDAALPSERYRSRSRLLEDFAESTAGILKEPQLERMGVLREFARDVLLGDRISVGIPLNGVRDGAAAPELVAESWLQAFSLDPSRRGALMPIAESFVGEGRRLLELHGAASGSGEVSSEARAAMERAFLDLQITTERRLFDRLSPDERELAGRSRPILLRFHSGNGTSRNVTTGSPF